MSNRAFDWITSNVVLEPLSYSATIPSLAIFAALTWTLTESRKLLEDSKLAQALVTLVSLVWIVSSNSSLFLDVKLAFLLIVDLFFPPE